jgi:dolichol-phosphate hexosyltransferase
MIGTAQNSCVPTLSEQADPLRLDQAALFDTEVSGADPSIRIRFKFSGVPVKLSILMPAYNEERTIMQAISEVLDANYPCSMELIVVDDGSTDATSSLLARVSDPRVKVHRHPVNSGKGAALLAAASFATGTHILPFDADLEYSAEDISRMVEPIMKGRCSVVYGTRLFGCNTVYQTYRYALGNRLLTRMANILFNACLSDLHTCLKLMPLATFRDLNPRERGFGLDSEITARLLINGIRPFEVPVSYYGRSHAEGKKITWRDAVSCVRILFCVRFQGRSRKNASLDMLQENRSRAQAATGLHVQQIGPAAAVLATNGDGDIFTEAVTG